MHVDGVCHCGRIELAAEVDPSSVVVCHCLDCQTISGAPYRALAIAPIGAMTVTGAPTLYEKRGSSGATIVTAFCGVCGSGLFSHPKVDPKTAAIRVGLLRQRRDLAPRRQGFTGSAMPWTCAIKDLPGSP